MQGFQVRDFVFPTSISCFILTKQRIFTSQIIIRNLLGNLRRLDTWEYTFISSDIISAPLLQSKGSGISIWLLGHRSMLPNIWDLQDITHPSWHLLCSDTWRGAFCQDSRAHTSLSKDLIQYTCLQDGINCSFLWLVLKRECKREGEIHFVVKVGLWWF